MDAPMMQYWWWVYHGSNQFLALCGCTLLSSSPGHQRQEHRPAAVKVRGPTGLQGRGHAGRQRQRRPRRRQNSPLMRGSCRATHAAAAHWHIGSGQVAPGGRRAPTLPPQEAARSFGARGLLLLLRTVLEQHDLLRPGVNEWGERNGGQRWRRNDAEMWQHSLCSVVMFSKQFRSP